MMICVTRSSHGRLNSCKFQCFRLCHRLLTTMVVLRMYMGASADLAQNTLCLEVYHWFHKYAHTWLRLFWKQKSNISFAAWQCISFDVRHEWCSSLRGICGCWCRWIWNFSTIVAWWSVGQNTGSFDFVTSGGAGQTGTHLPSITIMSKGGQQVDDGEFYNGD